MSRQFALTEAELAAFDRQGFIGPFRVYEPDEVAAICKDVRSQVHDRSRAPYPESDINYDRHLDIPVLGRHILRPQIVHRVQSVLGDDTICWRSEFFPKYPGQGPTAWHQVQTFAYGSGEPCLVPTVPASARTSPLELSVWTALTDARKDMGCLRFLPGSHKSMHYRDAKLEKFDELHTDGGFFGYDFDELKIDPEWQIDETKTLALEMKAGEAVIFTESLLHGSLGNITKRETRLAFTARYTATHVQVYPRRSTLVEHGQVLDLSRWGAVLTSGIDEHGHNRMRSTNAHDEAFVAQPR